MGNRIIKIGKEYERAFYSICTLFKNGFISSSVVKEVSEDNTRIVSESNNSEYVFSPNYKTIESDQKIEINESGATWFKSIREKTDVDFGSSSWLSLIEKVSTDFHKSNSFLEFEQKESVLTGAQETLHRKTLKEFMSMFYPNVTYSVKRAIGDDAIDDIYGVSLLVELDGGTGESQKVLCKVFFRKEGHKFNILSNEESKEIIDQIYEVIDKTNDQTERAISDSTIIESVLSEVEKIIDKKKFTESVILNGERDEKIISHFLETGPQGYVEINCRNVKVFGIYHVKWHNYPYEVYSNNEPVLRVVFDLKSRLTVSCLHCLDNTTPIVSENNIYYKENDTVKSYKLKLGKDRFGLTDDEIKNLKKNGEVSKHLILMMHEGFQRVKGGCRRLVCIDDLVEVDGERFCRNCPYPEVAFRSDDGLIYPTSSLAFARDRLSLIKKDDVKRCKCCNRTFSIDAIKRNKCKLCNKLEAVSPSDEENVFKKYKDYFPLLKRILSKDKAVAVEDEDIVLFKIGEKKYIFNKIDVDDIGFISSPKEVE